MVSEKTDSVGVVLSLCLCWCRCYNRTIPVFENILPWVLKPYLLLMIPLDAANIFRQIY